MGDQRQERLSPHEAYVYLLDLRRGIAQIQVPSPGKGARALRRKGIPVGWINKPENSRAYFNALEISQRNLTLLMEEHLEPHERSFDHLPADPRDLRAWLQIDRGHHFSTLHRAFLRLLDHLLVRVRACEGFTPWPEFDNTDRKLVRELLRCPGLRPSTKVAKAAGVEWSTASGRLVALRERHGYIHKPGPEGARKGIELHARVRHYLNQLQEDGELGPE